jgi:hypothetical protein
LANEKAPGLRNQRARRALESVVLCMDNRTKKSDALEIAPPDPKAVEAIGRALEAHYATLVEAPLPDKFVELLARLERDRASRTQGSEDAFG